MVYEIEYFRRAKEDFAEISDYLSQFYEHTLERFLRAYESRLALVCENPYMYKICPYNPLYRQMAVLDYVAFYKVTERTVEIYRILHGSRNTALLLLK